MYTSVVTAAGSTKNAYWEPPLARNDIVPLPALMSVGSSTTPQMVYAWREKTSVEEASEPGIRAGIRAVRARALLAIGGAAEGDLVAQGKAALVRRKRLVTATWSQTLPPADGRQARGAGSCREGLRALTSTFSDEEPTVV